MSRTDYSSYLRIDDLLELQQPLTPGAHDELLFIINHQVYELWFKLVLHELDHTAAALLSSRPQEAINPLRRAVRVEELLVAQLGVLELMSPVGFLEFRDPLTPASGLQSGQFRAIEYTSGIRDAAHVDDLGLSDHDRSELRRRAGAPTLYAALCASLRACGFDAPDGTSVTDKAQRLESLVALYRDHESCERTVLHEVCELMLDHDETVARWRANHVLMAAREIGGRQGTGGSTGVAYLQSTMTHRFFPELWEVRSLL